MVVGRGLEVSKPRYQIGDRVASYNANGDYGRRGVVMQRAYSFLACQWFYQVGWDAGFADWRAAFRLCPEMRMFPPGWDE